MRIPLIAFIVSILALVLSANAQTTSPARYVVHTDQAVGTIDEGIYGQFLEHIYNSVHGGIWGDQILNGTLELRPARAARSGGGGAPTTTTAPSLATPFYWELLNDGAALFNETQDPLNGAVSLRIVRNGSGPIAGIRQKNIAIQKGETYFVAVYLRALATTPAVQLSFADDTGEIFSKEISGLTDKWQRFAVAFVPTRSADNVSITIGLKNIGDVCVDQVMMFSASAMNTGGFRPDLLKAIADLKPASIRWPGGSFANTYIWQNGIGPVESRLSHPVEVWGDRDPNQFGTDEFMRLCDKVGAEPIIVLNTSRGVDDALNWLEYCMGDGTTTWGKVRIDNGHPAPYKLRTIEIDNETWLLMDKAKYMDIVNKFSPAIRAKYPDLKLSICGSYAFDTGPGEGRAEWNNAGWDQTMLDTIAKQFDVISPHYYNGLLAQHPPDYVNDPRKYEAQLADLAARISKSANPNIKIYVSEWNLTHAAWGNDWRVGLYAGGILNAFERQSANVVMTCPALFMRRTTATAWNNALINFDQSRWFPAGNYVVMKLFRESYAPNRLGLDGAEKPLNIVATQTEDGRTIFLKIVNPEPTAVDAEFALDGAFTPGVASMQLIAPGGETVKNSLDKPDQIKVEPHEVKVDGKTIRVNMPPLSVGVIRVTR